MISLFKPEGVYLTGNHFFPLLKELNLYNLILPCYS